MGKPGKVKAVSFVAKSGTGKTTLLEKLIVELRSRGYRVGALKSVSHQFEIDQPGKDSCRLTAAGAEATMIISPENLAFLQKQLTPPKVEDMIDRYFNEVDIVLLEGHRESSLPKIEVYREQRGEPLLCCEGGRKSDYLAVASDCPLELEIPVLDLNDAVSVADFLVREFLEN
jgi:molybdopterin-guanine dinucleotide biosynthesis protein MobB